MSRELRQVLFELRDQRLLQTFSRGEESIEGELVFPSEVGAVLDINNLVPRPFHFWSALVCVSSGFTIFASMPTPRLCRLLTGDSRLEGLGLCLESA